MGVRIARRKIRPGVMRERVLKTLSDLSAFVEQPPEGLSLQEQELLIVGFLADISERTFQGHWWQLRKDVNAVREKVSHYLPH